MTDGVDCPGKLVKLVENALGMIVGCDDIFGHEPAVDLGYIADRKVNVFKLQVMVLQDGCDLGECARYEKLDDQAGCGLGAHGKRFELVGLVLGKTEEIARTGHNHRPCAARGQP